MEEATLRTLRKNYIYNLSYQILLLITPFITTPYVSRVLCADGIGTVSYTDSVVSYFVLFATMGVTTYGQREISYVQKSVEDRSVVQIIWVRKELSPWQIIKQGRNYYIAGIVMALVLAGVNHFLSSGIIQTFIIIVVGAGVYFAVLLIFRDDFFISNVDKIVQRIKK